MSIMKYATIRYDIYMTMLDATRRMQEDIESGIGDGMYEDSPENAADLKAFAEALSYQPTIDEVSDPPEPRFLVTTDHEHGVADLTLSSVKENYTDEGLEYTNHYRCEDCDNEWTDTHSCACDDECSGCGKDYTPYESETNEDDADRDLTLYEWLDTCEEGDEYYSEEHEANFVRIK